MNGFFYCHKKESDFINEQDVVNYLYSLVCLHEIMHDMCLLFDKDDRAVRELKKADIYRKAFETLKNDLNGE